MGQININSVDDSVIAALDRIVSASGISRPAFLRQALDEIVEAHDAGRLAFAREEGPRLDSSLTALAVQLREAVTELERAQRENQKSSKKLTDAWNGGEDAARTAQERISAQINQHLREGFEPYRIAVSDVLGRVQALPETVAARLGGQLVGIDQKLADNRKLASQPRTAHYLTLSDAWHFSASALAVISGAIFVIGCFCGFLFSGSAEQPTKDPVLAIVPTPAAACRVVNYVFAAKDCRIPEPARQRAVDALRQEKRP
jgi:Ribbon-helix-helix protein, copG family